jgi:hypothetical protein
MGLNPRDMKKVPKEMSIKQCYERIYEWHKKYGKEIVKEKYRWDDAYRRAYWDLVDVLPHPDEATQADMDFVFGEVIAGLMEWSYHEEDANGIKMAAYAYFALNKQYPAGFADENFWKNRKSSKLFAQFPPTIWKEKYEHKDT